ncbi:MAG: BLUF domain-containing protein [Methylobacterium sp.]|uniref:BLUF domain-containing protein n=1 Tax=Methylobacterium sp. TaxID=409 RepID=UPI00258F6D54|nr:BLUF domain-containing protein [Methylobacterium sp.]MBY0296220.1 BLUF domain-containing protein [Methylobacterium sp.]
MSELYRLVYASKNLLQRPEEEVAASVVQILEASQRNNARAGVTGALMFNDGAFAQVLEGPRKGVEETFERIQCDDRHGDVTVLQCGPVERRGFANWSMAFVGQSARGQALWKGLAAESGFDPSRMSGDAVFAMLHGLVLEEEAAPVVQTPAHAPPAAPAPALPVDQLRAEIAQLRPDLPVPGSAADAASVKPPPAGRPDPGARPLLKGATEVAVAALRAALASERRTTAGLRDEIDALRLALAVSQDDASALRAERDLWAERAQRLAAALCQEAEEVRQGARLAGEPGGARRDQVWSAPSGQSAA